MDVITDNDEYTYIINGFYIIMILRELTEIKTWKIYNNKELIINLYGDFYPYPERKNKRVKDVCIKYNYIGDYFEILRKFTSVEFKKDDKKTKDHYELLKSLLPPI
jgi:hypothetical protein